MIRQELQHISSTKNEISVLSDLDHFCPSALVHFLFLLKRRSALMNENVVINWVFVIFASIAEHFSHGKTSSH